MFFTWNQVSILGMLAGAALSLGGVKQPDCFAPFFAALVHISAWIQFLPVGLLLNFAAARRQLNLNVLKLIPLKFIVMPAIIWLFCFFVFSDKTITATLVIQSACPVAINTDALLRALWSEDRAPAMAAFVSTTIVFLAVLCPIFFWLYL